jgi:hypothetical protein
MSTETSEAAVPLAEAATIYLEHRLAIEHARALAGRYLSGVWDLLPTAFAGELDGLRLPWVFRAGFPTKEDDKSWRGVDFCVESPTATSRLLTKPTIRLGDARFFPIPGQEVGLIFGAWETAEAVKLKKRCPLAISRLRTTLQDIPNLKVSEPGEKWEFARVGWRLGLRGVETDVKAALANTRAVAQVFERFTLGEFGEA